MFWRLVLLASLLLLYRASVAPAADQRAILDLVVNELHKGEITVLIRSEDVLVRLSDLETAGLHYVSGHRELIRSQKYVSLKSLAPQLSFKVDEKDLTLRITAQPSLLGTTVLELRSEKPADIVYREDTSGFFNYAMNVREFKGYDAFAESGLAIKNALLYGSVSRNPDGAVVRGLTNLMLSNRGTLNRTVFGDSLVNSDVLGGSVVMGGIRFARDFDLDPYFIRNPGLNYSGAVTTPSTVDVYVNDQLLRRISLPPGQFELRNLPVAAGSSDTRLVVRDAFGREQEYGSQYYFTSGLLKEGLHEFSYNLGSRRNNLGTESWDYGDLVFLGRHRFGLTDSLTGGMRLEASSSGLVSGGPSLSMRLPFGEMEFATAASSDHGASGGAAFLGYTYRGRRFNFGGSLRLLSPNYATTSLDALDKRSWMEFNAVAGWPIGSRLGVSMRYTFDNSQIDGQRQRFSLSASGRLTDRISLFVSGTHSQQNGKGSNTIYTGLSFCFGQVTGTLSYENRDGLGSETVSLQRSLPVGSGYGYRIQASANASSDTTIDSLLQYQGPYGRYEAGYSRLAGQNSTALRMAGGLAMVGRRFYLTRPVQASFGVIRIPGVANVRGYTSNQEVGYSNSDGDIFVSNLLPYYGNKLGISDKDIPLNYTIDATERVVAPPFRGGALAVFPVRRLQRATGTIALESSGQTIIPAYGQLTVTADKSKFESPIGKQGEFYLENVPAGRHKALVEYTDKSCEFILEVPNSEEPVITLEALRCLYP